jgi:hypothetical protein
MLLLTFDSSMARVFSSYIAGQVMGKGLQTTSRSSLIIGPPTIRKSNLVNSTPSCWSGCLVIWGLTNRRKK